MAKNVLVSMPFTQTYFKICHTFATQRRKRQKITRVCVCVNEQRIFFTITLSKKAYAYRLNLNVCVRL